MDALELRILHEANRARTEHGLNALERDDLLARVARAYSRLMAERDFFSHHAPVAGQESVGDRVRGAGGHYDGVGENIAMHPTSQASAAEFVEGWLSSPGHRENLLAPDWEVTGIGVFTAANGYVFATQLFGIPAAIALHDVRLEALPDTWHVLRVDLEVGQGYALGAFVRNRFVASADANARGRARLELEVPSEPGLHHVGIGRRRMGSDDGWIGVYDGIVEIHPDGGGEWRPATEGSFTVHEAGLYRVTGSALVVRIAGEARRRGLVVVDGTRTDEIGPGVFGSTAQFRGGTGAHTLDIGLPEGERSYRIVRRYHVDADRGELTSESKEAIAR